MQTQTAVIVSIVASASRTLATNPRHGALVVYVKQAWGIVTAFKLEITSGRETRGDRYRDGIRVFPDGRGGQVYACLFILPPGNYEVFQPYTEVVDWSGEYPIYRNKIPSVKAHVVPGMIMEVKSFD